ncbi:uncharacterized protein [Centruroides vittatus]|uniref:uncharacterized protein n=1 Tax=Centruroides vittatus TaxID=120091 RepID=UPI0035105DC3
MVLMKQHIYNKLLMEYINPTQCEKVDTNTVEKLHARLKRFSNTKLAKRLAIKNIVMDSPDTPRLFGFAKTHKQDQQICPVVDKVRAPTHKLEEFTHRLIAPHLEDYQFTVTNSQCLIELLKQIDTPPQFITVLDFKSLYPSFLLPPAFCAIRDLLFKIVADANLYQQILEMAHLLCYNSFFQFRGTVYKQGRGVPMGSPVAGDLCELVIWQLEEKILPNHLHNIQLYKRYVDDILILWKSKPDIAAFVDSFNNNSYGVTLGLEQANDTHVHFLDVSIMVEGTSILTEVYRKPLADQLYIPIGSCDPILYKLAAFNTLVKRAYTHSSTRHALQKEINTLRSIAQSHGYYNLISKLTKKWRNYQLSTQTNQHEQVTTEHKDNIPLTYNPYLRKLYLEVAKKKQVSITYKRCPNIYQLLRNAKDPPNQDKLPRVYAIPLKDHRCDEDLWYIGSTKKLLVARIKEHKADIRHQRCTTALARYATEPDIQPRFDEARIIHTTPLIHHLRWMEAVHIHKTARDKKCINSKEELSLSVAWQMLIYDG